MSVGSTSTPQIGSSLTVLRARGLYEEYTKRLDADVLARLLDQTMVTGWLPMEMALSHYEACDALQLPESTILEMGDVVGSRMSQSVMGDLVRLVRHGGVTPWMPLRRIDRLWARVYMGSTIELKEKGPKEGELVISGMPLARVTYWRTALRGLFRGIVDVFASSAYTRGGDRELDPHRVRYVLSWV